MRENKYLKCCIEICRNCQGTGAVEIEEKNEENAVCPVCDGSGRIKKTSEITIKIESYHGISS